MRALMPGYREIYYKDGKNPCHTKPAFTQYNILTVHMVILKNIVIYMHKRHKFPQLLPPSILDIIGGDAPVPGSTHETNVDWLNRNSTKTVRRSITYKGPLFYSDLMPKLTLYKNGDRDYNNDDDSTFKSIASFKGCVKKYLHKIQSTGDSNEWCGENMPLYYVPGLRRSNRNNY